MRVSRRAALLLTVVTIVQGGGAMAAAPAASPGWNFVGGTGKSFDRYSPLDLINASNIAKVGIVWTRPSLDPLLARQFPDLKPSNYFTSTPIIVGDTIYAADGVGLVEAFDAQTGATKWVQQPFKPTLQEAAGRSERNIEYWRSGADERIISVKGDWMYALDARTGALIPSFGEGGRTSIRRGGSAGRYSASGSLIVVGDLAIIGGNGGSHGAGDEGDFKEGIPEDIRGFDVRTGKQVWTFHVMPQPGDPARATWGAGSADFVGHMGNWAGMAADEARGIVYVPLSAPSNPAYGGHRPGDNLYSSSLVALDAKTGRRLWHFQMVHHDVWDYDNATPPTLARLKVGGRTIDAVIQANKNGFLFVFDRVTGKPVWPIEERPVPQGGAPGEHLSPTQPFPTRPPAFDRQGATPADLIDYTPELHAEAVKIASEFHMGPLYMPPEVVSETSKGSLSAPFSWGAGNWNTGAFDPQTGRYYAVSMSAPGFWALEKPKTPGATIAYERVEPMEAPAPSYGPGPQGLPLFKGPYGRVTAFDMNRGEKLWSVANGDGPRDHPALKGLNLPQLGVGGRPVPLLTKSFLFLGEPSDANLGHHGVAGPAQFRAYDKATGKVVWQTTIPAGTTGGPMTYAVKGRQFILVPVGGSAYGSGWVALAVKP